MTLNRLDRKGDETSTFVSVKKLDSVENPPNPSLIRKLNIKQQNQKAKELLFFTWDGPDNLRGVPQAHKGELVEPPWAYVPDFDWAPLPLVHYLFPGVPIWTASAKFKKNGGKNKKQKNAIVWKNSIIMQGLICIPFGKHLKSDNSKKFFTRKNKFKLKLQNLVAKTISYIVYFYLSLT